MILGRVKLFFTHMAQHGGWAPSLRHPLFGPFGFSEDSHRDLDIHSLKLTASSHLKICPGAPKGN